MLGHVLVAAEVCMCVCVCVYLSESAWAKRVS